MTQAIKEIPQEAADDALSGVFPAGTSESRAETVSHALQDARSLVGALMANLDWLEQELGAGSNSREVTESIGDMTAICGRLHSLLGQALREERHGPGCGEAQLEAAQLEDIAYGAVARGARAAQAKGVGLVVHGPQRATAVLDVRMVERVVDNLLENAIRVSPRGADVVIDYQRFGTVAVIAVSDEGPGVPAADVPSTFDVDIHGPGHGAGGELDFCQQVARAHSGSLRVENRPAGGASFILTLPQRKPQGTGLSPLGEVL